jgi:hypothetical protein
MGIPILRKPKNVKEQKMENTTETNTEPSAKVFIYKYGRIYFTKEGERRFYFFLTLVMLISGILYKIGIF